MEAGARGDRLRLCSEPVHDTVRWYSGSVHSFQVTDIRLFRLCVAVYTKHIDGEIVGSKYMLFINLDTEKTECPIIVL
jgi:hypothetical protein